MAGHRDGVICIDFDGVIHLYSKGWFDGSCYDEPMPGARESIIKLSERFKVVVLTARTDHEQVRQWLEKHGIPVDQVTNIKPPAIAYIDDRAVRFTNWTDVRNYFC